MVPVQAVQGEDDGMAALQLGIIAGKVGGYCETRLVPDAATARICSNLPMSSPRSLADRPLGAGGYIGKRSQLANFHIFEV